jgi:hypothetical protein
MHVGADVENKIASDIGVILFVVFYWHTACKV